MTPVTEKRGGPENSFQRFAADKKSTPQKDPREKPKEQRKDKPPQHLKLVGGETVKPGENLSVAHSFLQLFGFIQAHKLSLLRWIGTSNYQASLKRQRKASRVRKGAMLDTQIE